MLYGLLYNFNTEATVELLCRRLQDSGGDHARRAHGGRNALVSVVQRSA